MNVLLESSTESSDALSFVGPVECSVVPEFGDSDTSISLDGTPENNSPPPNPRISSCWEWDSDVSSSSAGSVCHSLLDVVAEKPTIDHDAEDCGNLAKDPVSPNDMLSQNDSLQFYFDSESASNETSVCSDFNDIQATDFDHILFDHIPRESEIGFGDTKPIKGCSGVSGEL
jgi:hypothetical protein